MKINELLEGGNDLKLTKNQWMADISNSAKQEIGGELINLVQTAYSNTSQGSFVNSIKDVIPSDWIIIDFDTDPDVDSCIFYRSPRGGELWSGHKIQGLGHDGTRASKDIAINKVNELLRLPGWWIESSGAMRTVLKKLDAPAITNVEVLQKLFNDPELTMIDTDTYTRILPIGGRVSETVFGNPKVK